MSLVCIKKCFHFFLPKYRNLREAHCLLPVKNWSTLWNLKDSIYSRAGEGAEGGSRSTWFSSDPNSAALSAVAPDNRRRRGLLLAGFWWSRNAKLPSSPCGTGPERSALLLGFTCANPPGLQSQAASMSTRRYMNMGSLQTHNLPYKSHTIEGTGLW